jgi:hypothetical protein
MVNVSSKMIGWLQVYQYPRLRIALLGILMLLLVGCSPGPAYVPDETMFATQFVLRDTATPAAIATTAPSPTAVTPQPTETAQPLSRMITVWVSPAVPERLHQLLYWGADLTPMRDADSADFQLVVLTERDGQAGAAAWMYALVAPFPTLLDDVALSDLLAAWRGSPPANLEGRPIFMGESTLLAFQSNWGPASKGVVRTAPAEKILELAWEEQTALALVPFEQMDPRWKIIRVNGMSPLDPGFNQGDYPLSLHFGLRGSSESDHEILSPSVGSFLPETNLDPERMTSVIMTGVTALARSTALRMEEEGVLYPAQDIQDVLRAADFTHISNEVPFFEGCPPAKPLRVGMRFCSDPGYIELLRAVGANIIELTGNHLLDWGQEGIVATLDLYQENEMAYYGGGYDLEDARQPLLIEHNGNRLAFLGCNAIGPEAVFATADSAGAAPCDRDWMEDTVRSLVHQGYLPVVTFQSIEVDDPRPHSMQRADFNRMAQAGAVIVSGSQAHIPQAMAFIENRFIHYGLGNLFFDQMEPWQRPQFIDRHVFYDGRYIHTELITTMLEDSSRPRLMTPEERQKLLIQIFEVSGW